MLYNNEFLAISMYVLFCIIVLYIFINKNNILTNIIYKFIRKRHNNTDEIQNMRINRQIEVLQEKLKKLEFLRTTDKETLIKLRNKNT